MTDEKIYEYKISVPPKPVGWWVLGKAQCHFTQFPMWVKPTPVQIHFHKIMLGWDWVDANEKD